MSEEDPHIIARYRFHATNGSACVFDAVGRDVRRPDRLTLRAAEVAARVMGSLDDPEDWAQWRVSVHDRSGRRVLVQPFVRPADPIARAA